MAKKKAARKKAVKKKPGRKAVGGGKAPAKRKSAAKKSTPKKAAQRKTAKKRTVKKKTASRKSRPTAAKRRPTLGRPKFTGEAPLDEVFKEDYHARQIFTFLGVSSLKELEKYGPEEIINRLSAPLVQTVQQIRKRLADNNRYLAGDLDYALERKTQRAAK